MDTMPRTSQEGVYPKAPKEYLTGNRAYLSLSPFTFSKRFGVQLSSQSEDIKNPTTESHDRKGHIKLGGGALKCVICCLLLESVWV